MSDPNTKPPGWVSTAAILAVVVGVISIPLIHAVEAWWNSLPLLAYVLLALVALGVGAFLVAFAWHFLLDLLKGGPKVEGIERKFPAEYRAPVAVTARELPFLGFSQGTFGDVLTFGRPWDNLGCVARQRSGKSAGICIPQLLMWDGPCIAASTKPDVMLATLARRRQLGPVWLWSPTEGGDIGGLEPLAVNLLAGCEAGLIAQKRATAFCEAARMAGGLPEDGFWSGQAADLMSTMFHAAAVSGGDLAAVWDWLSGGSPDSLKGALRRGEPSWGRDYEQFSELPDRTRGSILVTARGVMRATRTQMVMSRCCGPRFDIDRFLRERGTIYVVGSLEDMQEVAPLNVLLLEGVLGRAMELGKLSRLSRRLLTQLDEMPAVTPVPKLPTWLSQGAQLGLTFSWFAQNWPLVEATYGQTRAKAILEGSSIKMAFGGGMDRAWLEMVGSMLGVRTVDRKSVGSDGRHTITPMQEEVMLAHEIARMQPFKALVMLPTPYEVRTKRLADVPAFRAMMAGGAPVPPLERPTAPPAPDGSIEGGARRLFRRPARPEPAQATEHDSDQ